MKFFGGGFDIETNLDGRRGEKRVYDLLTQAFPSNDRWFAVYGQVVYQLTQPYFSKNVNRGAGIAPMKELDFIVVDQERGLLVIEVKGGHIRRSNDGWDSQNPRTSIWNRCPDPIEQARVAERNLMKRVVEQLAPTNFHQDMIWHGAAIIIPFCTVQPGPLPLGWDPCLVGDRRIENASDFEEWLERAFGHLTNQFGHYQRTNVPTEMRKVVRDCIRTKFSTEDLLRSQVHRLEELDDRDLMAKEPLNDWVRERLGRRKLLANGGAGTGKTQVASIRIAHTLRADSTARALYLCYNKVLAESVNDRLEPRFGIQIRACAFHDFCEKWIQQAGLRWSVPAIGAERDQFFRDGVLLQMLEAIKVRPPTADDLFDIVMFDEAQDFSMDWIECITDFMKPNAVQWALYDPTQFIFGNMVIGPDQPDLERDGMLKMRDDLRKRFGDEDGLLRAFRLSRKIFEFVQARDFDVGNGRMVQPFKDIECDSFALEGCDPIEERVAFTDAVEAIHKAILYAIDTLGFSARNIIVQAAVTTRNVEHPLFSPDDNPVESWNVAGRYRLRPITHNDISVGNVIPMATAQKFKGCERMCSIVLRTRSMDGKKLFTALTRARLHLHLIDIQ